MEKPVVVAPYQFFLESEIGRPLAKNARFHILPFPFEASVSYMGGAAQGPAAIIRASQQLELYDGVSYPGEAGIFTHPPLELSPETGRLAGGGAGGAVNDEAGGGAGGAVNDEAGGGAGGAVNDEAGGGAGVAVSDEAVAQLFQRAGDKTAAIMQAGALPVVLGGEHSISYGPIMAAAKHCGGNLGVVQIDAHADMRLAYEGRVWSHASVMRRCADAGIPIFQLGVRGLCREEVEYREKTPHVYYHDAHSLMQGPTGQIDTISLPKNFPANIYLTIDMDGLDPSIMPATGTPVPGGLLWYQTLSLLESIIRQRQTVAFDAVELAPQRENHAADFLAAQLVYNVMGLILRNSPQGHQ